MTRLEPGTVLDGIDRDGAARLIVGTPGSGKTEFALSVLMAGLRRYGGTQAVMAVSGRVAADATVPSVMVECGFMSNTEENSNLQKEIYQNKLAYLIMLGLNEYITEEL